MKYMMPGRSLLQGKRLAVENICSVVLRVASSGQGSMRKRTVAPFAP